MHAQGPAYRYHTPLRRRWNIRHAAPSSCLRRQKRRRRCHHLRCSARRKARLSRNSQSTLPTHTQYAPLSTQTFMPCRAVNNECLEAPTRHISIYVCHVTAARHARAPAAAESGSRLCCLYSGVRPAAGNGPVISAEDSTPANTWSGRVEE